MSNTHSPGAINTRTFDLTFVGESGDYKQYCILENDTTLSDCTDLNKWVTAVLPANYTVADVDNAKVLTIWLKNATGDISAPVSTGSVTLDRIAPSAPTTLTLITPASSPSAINATPVITVAGVTSGDTIGLYLDSACSTALLRGSTVASGASADVTASPLPPYHGLTLYAAAVDPAGNQSACSAAEVDYQYNPSIALVSSTDGTAANEDNNSSSPMAITPDGRYVLFQSSATNLLPGASGSQVYVKDFTTGAITLVSSIDGSAAQRDLSGQSYPSAITPDGRYVAFYSNSTNLISGTTRTQGYVKDLVGGDVALVSSIDGTVGTQDTSGSSYPMGITRDGSYVTFQSNSTNLVSGTTGIQAYGKDLQAGNLMLLSSTDGTVANEDDSGSSSPVAITPDGRYVLLGSSASNLVAGASGQQSYVKDLKTGAITLASSTDGTVANEDDSGTSSPTAMTPDGRYVVFQSSAGNFWGGSKPGAQAYVKDLQSGAIRLVSSTDGSAVDEDDSGSSWPSAITPDGRYVTFDSGATVFGGVSLQTQSYLKDLKGGAITLVDSPDGSGANGGDQGSWSAGMATDAKFVLFGGSSTNLVSSGTKNQQSFIKFFSRGPMVSVIYPAENSYIAVADAGAVTFMGTCSENEQAVHINAGGITPNPICHHGLWTTTIDISGLAHGVVAVTADHSTATQDTRYFSLGTPVIGSVAVINPTFGKLHSPIFDLSFTSEVGAYTSYCILENDTKVGDCTTWIVGALPPNYTILGGDGAKVLTVWLKNVSGDISQPVSTPSVTLERPTIALVSSTDGTAITESDTDGSTATAITPDGRYVLFKSDATNLVSGASGNQVYVSDRSTGAVTLVSSIDGTFKTEGDGASTSTAITPDGRYVLFISSSINLVPGATLQQAYLKDLTDGTITLVSSTDGLVKNEGDGASTSAAITPDGRYVTFYSNSTNLVSGASGTQAYVKDRTSGAITLVSSRDGTVGSEGDAPSMSTAITPDGRYVLFDSNSTNFVSGVSFPQVFVKDRTSGAIVLVSSTDGTGKNQGDGPSNRGAITPDGRYVVFESNATNLVSGATGGQVYLKDLQTAQIQLVSSTDGTGINKGDFPSNWGAITPDGRYISFNSNSTNLVSGATGGQVYLKDLTTGTIQLVSSTDGLVANEATAPLGTGYAISASLTPDARAVLFRSNATNFVSGASGVQAYIKSYTRGPVVSVTYPAENTSIPAANTNNVIVSGFCSEEGQDVLINAGGVTDTQTCTSGMWKSKSLDLHLLPYGPIGVTADHSSAGAVPAPQAQRIFGLGVPVLVSAAVTNTSAPGAIDNSTFDLSYSAVLGDYEKYCILDNDLVFGHCTWVKAKLPASYDVTSGNGSVVLTIWLKTAAGDISALVSTPSLLLTVAASSVTLVSSTDGTTLHQGDISSTPAAITPDGKYALFKSAADNLVTGVTGVQVYLKNLQSGAITLVSTADGTVALRGNAPSTAVAITPDGRYVLFSSGATNLLALVAGGQAYVRDQTTGTITLASCSAADCTPGNSTSTATAITPDGRYVVFNSYSTNLVSGAHDGQVYLKDLTSGALTLVSSTDGTFTKEGDGNSFSAAITDDGRYVLFQSNSINLVSGVTGLQAYLKDLSNGAITLVSSTDGTAAHEGDVSSYPFAITPDGRYALFMSTATNLVSGTSGQQVYVKDLQTAAITLVSSTNGTAAGEANGDVEMPGAITPDGRYVTYRSNATNLISGTSGIQAYLKDLQTGGIQLVSSTNWTVGHESTLGDFKGNIVQNTPVAMTPDARAVLFASNASDLVSGASLQQAYLNSRSVGPVVLVTYPAEHSYIAAADGGALKVSGYCSEEGQAVAINAGGVTDTQTCTYGMWASTLNISGLTHGSIHVTADHSSAGSVAAPQASRQFTFGVLVLGSVAVSNPTGTSLINTTTFDLTFTGQIGSYSQYCILENDTTVDDCTTMGSTWTAGPLPATYIVTGAENAKVLTVWLKDGGGAISTPVSTPVLALDTTPPTAPSSLTLVTPASSPSATNATPVIQVGALTSGDTVGLYLDSACTSAFQVGSSISSGANSQVTASPLPPYSILTLYAGAIDPAGNLSCSVASLSYQYVPPIALVSSTDGTGAHKDNNHANPTTITPDGKYVLFVSDGTNLVPGATLGQVYLKNLHTGKITLVSTTDGTVAHQGNSYSNPAGMTPDGRYVVFSSDSTNFVSGASGSGDQVYMKDLTVGGITLVSSIDGTGATHGDYGSYASAITPDGRYVLFQSQATNLVSGASGLQTYLKDLTSGVITLVSSTDGTPATESDGATWPVAITADAKNVLFGANATNLVPGVSGYQSYVKNLSTGEIQLVSSVNGTAATQSNAEFQVAGALTPDGRYVIFASNATNLMSGAVGIQSYLKDLGTGAITLVSSVDGTTAQSDLSDWASSTAITPDGRYVLFDYVGDASLVSGATGTQSYLKDLASGEITLVSSTDGTPGGQGDGTSLPSALTPDARLLLMQSTSTNFVLGATGQQAYVKYKSRSPSVSVTYPAASSSINPADTSAVTVSGYCSEEGVAVNVNASAEFTHDYDVSAPLTCTSGMWSTVMDLSGMPHTAGIGIHATHSTAAPAARYFNIGVPVLGAVHVTNTPSAGVIGTRTFDLGYSGESGAYTKYCILEGDTDVAHCTWTVGPLPSTYLVTNFDGAKVLNVWLQNATGDISQYVSTPPVNLEAMVTIADDSGAGAGFGGGTAVGVAFGTLSDGSSTGLKLASGGGCDGANVNCAELHSSWTPHFGNLTAYWKMNELSGGSLVDSSGSSNHANIVGSVAFGAPGALGSAVKFDGTGYATIAAAPTTGSGDFTIQAWIKTSATGVRQQVMNYGAFDPLAGLHFFVTATNKVGFDLSNTPGPTSTVTVTDGKWHHIAAVNTSGSIQIYVDGSASGSPASMSPNIASVGGNIGFLPFSNPGVSTTWYFYGAIDELAVWDVGMSPNDIATLYDVQSTKIQAPYGGYFISRVMDAVTSVTWNSFSWATTLPFFKELPDYASGAVQNETSANYSSLVGSTGGVGDDDLMSGIVGLWHLDEAGGTVAHDSSGAGRDGVIHGAVAVGVAGKLGNAMSFNNTAAQYISATDAGLPIDQAARTIAFWAYPTHIDNQYHCAVGYGSLTGTNFFGVEINSTDNTWIVTQYGAGVEGTEARLNVWQHVVATYDGTLYKIYVDGVLINSASMSTTTHLSGNWVIGSRDPTGVSPFGGSLDEVAIWSRALGATEVQQLYQRGASRIKYQVRACTDGACASGSPAWQGPDGTPNTYFSELENRSVQSASPGGTVNAAPPVLTLQSYLNSLAAHRYFQYRAIFESDSSTTTLMPELKSVTATGLP